MVNPVILLRAMRPTQWTKNGIVAAAFFFAYWDRLRTEPLSLRDLGTVIPAVLLFCLTSSAVYIVNDIFDKKADSHHPLKKNRPIASGALPVGIACIAATALFALSFIGSVLLSKSFATVILSYVVLQLIYSSGLKRVPLLDVMMIASGFVLRALGGAVALSGITISPWLLLCTFLLSLVLALCKRRHERLLLDESSENRQRPGLEKYDSCLLDQLIAITASATITAYAIYTMWPETVRKFGTHRMGFTIPFVIFGVFRYLDIAYRHGKGERPEKVLLTDIPILVDIALYAVAVAVIVITSR